MVSHKFTNRHLIWCLTTVLVNCGFEIFQCLQSVRVDLIFKIHPSEKSIGVGSGKRATTRQDISRLLLEVKFAIFTTVLPKFVVKEILAVNSRNWHQ